MRSSIPVAALALGAALASAPALAHDLSWSITVGSGGAVGVHIGVPGVAVVTPAPVVVAPPRYAYPAPVVVAPPRYPHPVVVAPPRHVVLPAWPMVPAYAAPAVFRPMPVTYAPHAHGKHPHAGHRGNSRSHPRHR